MTQHEFQADERAATQRLDVFLAGALQTSRSHAQRLIREHQVKVNDRLQKTSYTMESEDIVTATIPETPVYPKITLSLPIIYEDSDIVVIDKPAGLPAHAGSGTAGQATVADFSRYHTTDPDSERPGIVHRLDLDTSGLMIIAKNIQAKTFLQEQFRNHTVRKTYTLLATGRVDPPEAIIRLPLDRDPARPLRRAVVASGREAVTSYRTLANYPGFTLVEARPQTGRTHQLRVHFAAVGHAIAGDTTYGPPVRPLRLKRQFLHASAIGFTATSGQIINLTSPLPPELKQCLTTLENRV